MMGDCPPSLSIFVCHRKATSSGVPCYRPATSSQYAEGATTKRK